MGKYVKVYKSYNEPKTKEVQTETMIIAATATSTVTVMMMTAVKIMTTAMSKNLFFFPVLTSLTLLLAQNLYGQGNIKVVASLTAKNRCLPDVTSCS
jgi:hypothetical protein